MKSILKVTRNTRYRWVLFVLATIGYTANAVVIRRPGTEAEAVALASGVSGIFSDCVARVYYSNDRRSTTPAALISKNRVLVFTNKPQNIESVELKIQEEPEEYKKYRVTAIAEIYRQDRGVLVCCVVERNFEDSVSFFECAMPHNRDQEAHTRQVTGDSSVFWRHPSAGSFFGRDYSCKDGFIVGFGRNINPDTREHEGSDALKAADACIFQIPEKPSYLYCPFDEEGIAPSHDGRIVAKHKKLQGWVGPDDLGALLVAKDGKTLLGFASRAGTSCIYDRNYSFSGSGRRSTFLRVSSISHLLADIQTKPIRDNSYTDIYGISRFLQVTARSATGPARPIIPNPVPQPAQEPSDPQTPRESALAPLPGRSLVPIADSLPWAQPNLAAAASATESAPAEIPIGRPEHMRHNEAIGNSWVLIDPSIVLTTNMRQFNGHELFQYWHPITIAGKEYKIKDIRSNDILTPQYYLLCLEKPVTDIPCIKRYRAPINLDGSAIYEDNGMYFWRHPQTREDYLVGFADSPTGDIQLGQELQAWIDHTIISHALSGK